MVEPRTPLEGAFAVDSPCPDCGNKSILGFLYLNQHGLHMHTHYVCTFWNSPADKNIIRVPDHYDTTSRARCGWHGWSVPTPKGNPTLERLEEALDSLPLLVTAPDAEWAGNIVQPFLETVSAARALAEEVRKEHNEQV